MTNTLQEIQERFDKIKDHKPKATKKLNELGDILASAYKISPETADEMWQYIIDLNISEDIANSDFYIAQVFNKLVSRLSQSRLTEFVSMNPERVYNLIIYGYNGAKTWNVKLWECLDILIHGYIETNRIDEAVQCIEYFYEKYGGIWSDRKEIYRTARRVASTCIEYYIKNGNHIKEAENLLNIIGQTENPEINTIVEITQTICFSDVCEDYDMLFYLTRKCKEPVEFFDLLWQSREQFSIDELKEKWIEYVSECDDEDIKPWNYIHDDEKLNFYVEVEKNEDELLDYYFNRAKLYDVERGVVYSWVKDEDWERFVKYISQSIIATGESSVDLTLKNLLTNLKSACLSGNNRRVASEYRYRDFKFDKEQIEPFAMSLAKISAITLGCECHDDYHALIKEFVKKVNKDTFNEIGYPEETAKKSKKNFQTPEQQLKDYVKNFLSSGEALHKKSDIHDSLIEQLEIDDYSPKATNKVYRLACDDEISKFYFCYAIKEYKIRKSLISSCVKKNDLEQALNLIDMMISTKDKPNYKGTTGWGYQNTLTILDLINEYDYSIKGTSQASEINDEKRQLVRQLVERIIGHLPDNLQEKIISEIYRITPIEDSFEAYIANLLEDVDIYTGEIISTKKVNVNRLSDRLEKAFSKLAAKDRYDIIYHIMLKLAKSERPYNSLTYPIWMWRLIRGVSGRVLMKLLRNYPEIFTVWLEHPSIKDSDIREVAEIFGEGCTKEDFLVYRDMVLNHKGFIEGVDNCFKRTSKNTETQLLCDGASAILELDYIDIFGSCPRASFNPIGNITFYILTTQKTKKLNSVRVLSCKINDLDVNSMGFICDFDDGGPTVGYELYKKKSKDELTIYSDFFEDNKITHVSKIEIEFVLMDENQGIIETSPTIIIEYDIHSGYYKVV